VGSSSKGWGTEERICAKATDLGIGGTVYSLNFFGTWSTGFGGSGGCWIDSTGGLVGTSARKGLLGGGGGVGGAGISAAGVCGGLTMYDEVWERMAENVDGGAGLSALSTLTNGGGSFDCLLGCTGAVGGCCCG